MREPLVARRVIINKGPKLIKPDKDWGVVLVTRNRWFIVNSFPFSNMYEKKDAISQANKIVFLNTGKRNNIFHQVSIHYGISEKDIYGVMII